MAREYFNAYHSYIKSIDPLNDAERGRLFTALLEYSRTGTTPELRGNERFVFPTIKEQIDRDIEKYRQKCEKLRQNGVLGGQANAPQMGANASKCPPNAPKGKGKGKGKEKGEGKLFTPDSKPYKCALFLASEIKARLPQGKPADEKQLQSWADSFDKVNRIDGYDWKTIGEVLEFSQSDSFWQKNILSGATFRKQFIKLYAKRSDSTG